MKKGVYGSEVCGRYFENKLQEKLKSMGKGVEPVQSRLLYAFRGKKESSCSRA